MLVVFASRNYECFTTVGQNYQIYQADLRVLDHLKIDWNT